MSICNFTMLFVHVYFELATRIYIKENGWQNSSAERHINAGKYSCRADILDWCLSFHSSLRKGLPLRTVSGPFGNAYWRRVTTGSYWTLHCWASLEKRCRWLVCGGVPLFWPRHEVTVLNRGFLLKTKLSRSFMNKDHMTISLENKEKELVILKFHFWWWPIHFPFFSTLGKKEKTKFSLIISLPS